MVVCSCIYLTSKIFEDERKIRDILNAINSAIKLYQLGREQGDETGSYIGLREVVQSGDSNELEARIQPSYELTSNSSYTQCTTN